MIKIMTKGMLIFSIPYEILFLYVLFKKSFQNAIKLSFMIDMSSYHNC